ncbi:hypothetical protein BBO99_00007248 [Phytophthora kernoviae]|uniref:Pantothenate kinase n=2 Tax=Phytophthora kernoviae TaxID=325452 RepID=A0A3R7J6J4_9STRA|nr:hypothetical protein G195_010611 [Phytophthora kernoviae 00238/432]KAG2515810.1 hypothetical protein JM16_006789 [Phytophthora kernoviae]KAG2519238.1 hypothetical protein JM18_006684 [Phytophthora kernoviae]RLN10727.1 hypothetical protein BBI17_007211 [Phytophthora kernoviae]RLN76817.1 hypothetical protein BBO99_00007248 [Phytophthora kernoviae]
MMVFNDGETLMQEAALDGGGAQRALVTGGFLLFSSSVALLCLQRKRDRQRVWRQRLTYKKLSKSSDLGTCFGLDIGGTLAKIVYFERHENANDNRKRPRSASHDVAAGEMNKFLRENHSFGSTGVQDVRLRIHSKTLNGVFHFVRFESSKTRDAIEFIANNGINQSLRILPCTGGGAHKYGPAFNEMAAIELEKYDEIECTIAGLHLLLTTLSDEVYTFEDVDFSSLAASRVKTIQYDVDEDIYPYLLVSIGSGVSVLYVKGPGDYERVSGSSIGGGTYWGLCRLLTHCESYDEALDLCVHGSNHSVDMSVGDIYATKYKHPNAFAMPVSVFGFHTNTSLDPTFDKDIRDLHLINDYDAGSPEGKSEKWCYELWFFSHDRVVYAIHGGPMAVRMNYQTCAYQCIRPGELWQCNWLEEIGTIVSLVFDIKQQKLTAMIGFSKGHWEHPMEAYGDKRNAEDFTR